jgi:polyferredoxin
VNINETTANKKNPNHSNVRFVSSYLLLLLAISHNNGSFSRNYHGKLTSICNTVRVLPILRKVFLRMDLPSWCNPRTLRHSKKGFKNGKKNLIKYAIWAPWITIIALMFFQAGGVKAVDPLYQTYYGISISNIYSAVIFIAIAGLIAGLALAAGKRASCHTICWMAPFMIIGRKIRNTVNWPSLQLVADKEKCVNCKVCNQKCPMSLAVESMVQQNSMENSECILCGSCIDSCPKQVIKYSFGKKRNQTNFQEQGITH